MGRRLRKTLVAAGALAIVAAVPALAVGGALFASPALQMSGGGFAADMAAREFASRAAARANVWGAALGDAVAPPLLRAYEQVAQQQEREHRGSDLTARQRFPQLFSDSD